MTIWHFFLAPSHVILTILHLYFCKGLPYSLFSLPYETQEHFFRGGWWSRAHFVSYFNTTGKEAPNSDSQNKNKNITPKGISAEIFVARFWRLCRGHTSRVLVLYRRVRHQTAMAILTGCTYPTAAEAACPCKKGRVFLAWQQQLRHLCRPAGLKQVPPSPKSASFHSGCAIPDQWHPLSAGWREEAWAAALSCPTAFLPAQGSWQGGEPRPREQAARSQGSPLGSLGARGGPAMPVLAAERGQLNPPTLAAWGGERGKGKEGNED